MLNKNLFDKKRRRVSRYGGEYIFTLAGFADDANIVLKVDNLEEPSGNTNIFLELRRRCR